MSSSSPARASHASGSPGPGPNSAANRARREPPEERGSEGEAHQHLGHRRGQAAAPRDRGGDPTRGDDRRDLREQARHQVMPPFTGTTWPVM
jgi:hypothetical protein